MEPSRTYSTVTPNHRTHELIIEFSPSDCLSVADAINLWLLNWTKAGEFRTRMRGTGPDWIKQEEMMILSDDSLPIFPGR